VGNRGRLFGQHGAVEVACGGLRGSQRVGEGEHLRGRQSERGRHEADGAGDFSHLSSVAQDVARFLGQECETYHSSFFPFSDERLCNFGRSLIHCHEYNRSQVDVRKTIAGCHISRNTLEHSHLSFLQNEHTGQQRQYTSELLTVKQKNIRSTSLGKEQTQ
jgi:hypothetical protein